MIIRYCIRTSPNSKKNAEVLKNKLISITPSGTIIDVASDDNGKLSAQGFFKHVSKIIDAEFDYLVVLDDSLIVNEHIHSNLISSPDTRAAGVGLIHLTMPTSATIFSSNTLFDLDDRVYFRTDVVYDSRGLVFSKKLLQKMPIKEMARRNIFSLSHFVTKGIKEYKMNHTIHYPSLAATIKNNVFLDEYDFEIIDDLFSASWSRGRLDAEAIRFNFIAKNYRLHEKSGYLDDFGGAGDYDNSESNRNQLILPQAAPVEPTAPIARPSSKKIYFLDLGSAYTWNIFVQQLSDIVELEVVRSLEAAIGLMQKGHSIFANGFHVRFIEITQRFPMQLNCFWHSSYSGVDVMQERSLFISFLEAIASRQARGFFLNPHEALAPNAKRFWLPFSMPDSELLSTQEQYDFAIVASSPYSVTCKNVLATIIFLLHNNYSFVIPKWLADEYRIDLLKKAYLSSSVIEAFETHRIPIETSYYQKAKYYLMTSLTDTMPYSCIESVSCGTPFIITRGVGWASYFEGDCFVLDSLYQLSGFYEMHRNDEVFRESVHREQLDKLKKISKVNQRMLSKLFNNYS